MRERTYFMSEGSTTLKRSYTNSLLLPMHRQYLIQNDNLFYSPHFFFFKTKTNIMNRQNKKSAICNTITQYKKTNNKEIANLISKEQKRCDTYIISRRENGQVSFVCGSSEIGIFGPFRKPPNSSAGS